jgi:hypothetical protein
MKIELPKATDQMTADLANHADDLVTRSLNGVLDLAETRHQRAVIALMATCAMSRRALVEVCRSYGGPPDQRVMAAVIDELAATLHRANLSTFEQMEKRRAK